MDNKITINALIQANTPKVWKCYTSPEHIVNWNFADPSWHCPSASNDLRVGGRYITRMEARDGSVGFDFEAVYNEIRPGEGFRYTMPDGREVTVDLKREDDKTRVTVAFDPEKLNPEEMQRAGWQAILNNFKGYMESL
jgi:uncharacterized protein YndB with AHSA1/START domain